VYRHDARWAYIVMCCMYPVICATSQQDDEFVLSEHTYCLHERPNMPGVAYTEFHIMYVIGPHIVLLLRSDLLPEIVEDMDDAAKQTRERELAKGMRAYPNPDQARSLLHDLPVAKPQKTYTRDVHNRMVFSGTGVPTVETDKLLFPLFSIDSETVQLIISVIFEKAFGLSTIVYCTSTALRLALDFYLALSTREGDFSMKNVLDEPDLKYLYLKKLQSVSHNLGSTTKVVCKVKRSTKYQGVDWLSKQPLIRSRSRVTSLC
ncbi:hypothetical protein CC86DRAFT_297170, partial [Ophiobolus disseminans]